MTNLVSFKREGGDGWIIIEEETIKGYEVVPSLGLCSIITTLGSFYIDYKTYHEYLEKGTTVVG